MGAMENSGPQVLSPAHCPGLTFPVVPTWPFQSHPPGHSHPPGPSSPLSPLSPLCSWLQPGPVSYSPQKYTAYISTQVKLPPPSSMRCVKQLLREFTGPVERLWEMLLPPLLNTCNLGPLPSHQAQPSPGFLFICSHS